MNFRGIRPSKFRHVFGSQAKKEKCYDQVKITRNAHDSNYCAVNPKFLAVVVEVGGGGSFVVIPLDKTGRSEHVAKKVNGHSRPVSDIKWNPFNDNIIASGSEDCTVKLWYIPDGGLATDLNEFLIELYGHRRRVTIVEWHPTAENVLLSCGYDHRIIVWNVARAEAVNYIECHTDVIYSMSFNRNGSLLATSSKDKKIRIIDPRNGEVLREGNSHQGTKACKVVYLGDTTRLFTTGFSKFSDRQYAVWSQNDLSKPLVMESIDSSSGVLFPYYDHDTKIVYVAGKGDGNVRYYEVLDEDPWIFYLSQFISGAPQRGFGVLPKRGCETQSCEIFRFYKLHATKDLVEPISMIVPRKSEIFQDDIYPETAAPIPSLTAEEWIAGKNSNPQLMSLKTGTRVRTYKPVVYKPSEQSIVISDKNNDRKYMFLSEETKPDYRPIDRRTDLRPSPQIDHRPLGADSYNKPTSPTPLTPPPPSTTTTSGVPEPKTSKVLEVQRKLTAVHNLESDSDDPLETIIRKNKSVTSGANSVKNLTNRFSLISDQNGHSKPNKNEDAFSLRQTVKEQRKEIETLKAQVAAKDNRIRQLEEQVKTLSVNVTLYTAADNNLHVSESLA